jgi:hypothetical protein
MHELANTFVTYMRMSSCELLFNRGVNIALLEHVYRLFNRDQINYSMYVKLRSNTLYVMLRPRTLCT